MECIMCDAKENFDERHTGLCVSCVAEGLEEFETFLCTVCESKCIRGYTKAYTLCDKCLKRDDLKTCERCGEKTGKLTDGKCGMCITEKREEFAPPGISMDDMKTFDDFEEAVKGGKGMTDELRKRTFDCYKRHEDHCDDAVYDTPLLKLFLLGDHDFMGENLRSAISRCIERKLPESLELLLPAEMKTSKSLFLRWIGTAELYLKARKAGWCDFEWEKRVVGIQKLWRAHKAKTPKPKLEFKYTGPDLGEYEDSNKYFGYRHSMYAVRWNRKHRFRFYSTLLKYKRWGDCAWQAYANLLGEDEKSLKNLRMEE